MKLHVLALASFAVVSGAFAEAVKPDGSAVHDTVIAPSSATPESGALTTGTNTFTGSAVIDPSSGAPGEGSGTLILTGGGINTGGATILTDSAGARRAESPVYAGVEIIPVDAPTRALFKLPESGGLFVIGVAPGSPADGRLGQGDILMKLGDQVLVNRDQLRALLRPRKVGETATFEIVRGGRTESVTVKLAASPGGFALGFVPSNLPGFREGRIEALKPRLNDRVRRMLEESGMDDSTLNRTLSEATVTLDDDSEREGAEGKGAGFELSFGNNGFTAITSRTVKKPEGSVLMVERDGKKSVTVKDAGGKALVEGELTEALEAKLPDWAKPVVNDWTKSDAKSGRAPTKQSANLKPKTPVADESGARRFVRGLTA